MNEFLAVDPIQMAGSTARLLCICLNCGGSTAKFCQLTSLIECDRLCQDAYPFCRLGTLTLWLYSNLWMIRYAVANASYKLKKPSLLPTKPSLPIYKLSLRSHLLTLVPLKRSLLLLKRSLLLLKRSLLPLMQLLGMVKRSLVTVKLWSR
jgi:hypothetical protein